jgi:hypothetical protein
MLAAVEFDDQAPLAAHEVDVVSVDRLLADKFAATALPSANSCPERELRGREGAPQRPRPARALLIPAPQGLTPSA